MSMKQQIYPSKNYIKALFPKVVLICVLLCSAATVGAAKDNAGSGFGSGNYAGWETYNAPRRLEADAIKVSRGVFVRPTEFVGWRSVYWIEFFSGVPFITVSVTVANSLQVTFKQNGADTAVSNISGDGTVFSAVFNLSSDKVMTEIEVIVSDGTNMRSYYLDVCGKDPMSHDIAAAYYSLPAYPETWDATRVLVDQIAGGYDITQKRIEFVANYLVGSQKNTRNLIDPVQAINPGWHSLHYHLAIWNGPAQIIIDNAWTQSEWQYLTNELYKQDPHIFMYAINKNTGNTTLVQDEHYGAYLMNITSETYYQYLLDSLEYQCKSTGYDSIFLDSYSIATVYSFTNFNYISLGGGANVPNEFTTYQNPQLGGLTWLQASEEFISRLTKDLNLRGIWLMPNLGNMITTWDPLDYALPNGGMLEGTPVRPDNSRDKTDQYYLYDWVQSMSRTMYLSQNDKVIILQPSVGDVNNTDYRLFVIGEYLMVRGRHTYINMCFSGQAQASWYPEYEIDLGAPTQTHMIPDEVFIPRKDSIDKALLNYKQGDLYVRRFEKGIVILNPHRTAMQYTVPSDKAYQAAVISGGGTVPTTGINDLMYSLSWVDVAVGAVRTIPAESALILRFAQDDTSTVPSASVSDNVTAYPTTSTVVVNGRNVPFDAYNIGGNNYLKLRDLAYTLTGTEKQFAVSWDEAANMISLTSGYPYTVVGGEMEGKGSGAKTAAPIKSKVFLDGKEVVLTAYNIGGNNYFRLRDIGEAFDFGVDWKEDIREIHIDTSKGYSPP